MMQQQDDNTQDEKPNYLKRLFLVIAFFAALNCYARADYNLPLFVFAYLLWDHEPTQKVRFIYLFVFTWIIDLTWIAYWGSLWDSDKQNPNYYAKGIQMFVLVLSIINLFLKLICIFFGWYQEHECKEALSVDGFKSHSLQLAQTYKK